MSIEPQPQLTVVHRSPVWLRRTEAWLHEQITMLPASVTSHVVCDRLSEPELFPVPHLSALSSNGRMRFVWDKGLRRLGLRRHSGFLLECTRRGADLLHSHFGPTGWADVPVARRARVKHVVTFYGYDAQRVPREDGRWFDRYAELFESVDRVLCEGPHLAQTVVGLGCPRDKVRVHHLGVRVADLPFVPRAYETGPLRVLIASSFREKKGIPYAIEALGRLARDLRLVVTIVGDTDGTPEGDREKARIRQAVEHHGIDQSVRFLGFLTHGELVEEAYRNHVCVAPSLEAADGDTEGGAPMILVLFAATGMPVVSTRHCDIPDVLADGAHLLAEERDVEGLVARLHWLLENRWNDFLARLRRRMEEEYDSERQGLRLAAHYTEVVQ
jgi:colanic acid/amylovoran biosynthesis glycosyltransferase